MSGTNQINLDTATHPQDVTGKIMNPNRTLIETLAKSQPYQDYEKAYTEVTRMPLALIPTQTWNLPLPGNRMANPFCALVAGNSRTCAVCLQMRETLRRNALTQPATGTCAYGFCEAAVPIRLGHETIGFLQTGQALRHKPTATGFARVTSQLEEKGLDADPRKIRDAYFHSPVITRKELDSATSLLTIFAEHLAMKCNQIAMQLDNAEPPAIASAKRFIEQHHAEDLSLSRVAQTVHTSIFHFCKLFKKATGLNFTEFVSRTRVEKAKNLLLNPNLRVTEIAYEAGFQSLTHFNRVFKHVAGQSPTEYRVQLSGMPS
jgi:AraC-like DNA-binding protein